MRTRIMTTSSPGITLLEVLVGLAIFAIGCLTFTQVMFGVMQVKAGGRHAAVAASLAHERMAQIVSVRRFSEINEANFPDEGYGQVRGGAAEFQAYRRFVTIADSTDAWGQSILKEIKVEVQWRENGRLRNVSLRSILPSGS